MEPRINLGVVAERYFVRDANGVHTAVHQLVEQLRQRSDVRVAVNPKHDHSDVIHAHTIGLQYLLAAAKHQQRVIVSAHVVPESFRGNLAFEHVFYVLGRWYLKFAFNQARLVLAVSPAVKTQLEQIGVTSEIAVLCNSVDRSRFRPDPEARRQRRCELGLAETDCVCVCVGQIQPRKGVHTFLNVAAQLPYVKFVWVGGRPFGRLTAEYDAMTRLVENAPPNVMFVDTVPFEHMPGYYALADIFLFPSFQENFAYAILEACATHLPLVLRKTPEYPQYLFTHYLAAETDAEFVALVHRLATDLAFREHWREESNTLAANYDLRAYMRQLMQHYTSVARSS